MFGIISRIISSVAAFLFPIFASYKALKANDQHQLTPWLMYWVVIACVIVIENFFGWFLNLLPLYQEVKAVFLLWLVLPQTQGATYLYLTYVHPYILTHETDIEQLISTGHDQLKRVGMTYLRKAWAFIQELLGVPPQDRTRPPTPPQQSQAQAPSYAQSLLQKFSLPPIGPFDPQSTFLSSLLSPFTALPTTTATTTSPDGTHDLSASTIISNFQLPNLPREEKLSYIEAQKRKLVEYIKYLDDAAAQQHNEDLRPSSQTGPRPVSSPRNVPATFPSPPHAETESRRWSSGGGEPFVPQFEEGFEAVELPGVGGSVLVEASGVGRTDDEVTRRGWFSSWGSGGGWRSVSAPQTPAAQ